MNTIGRDSEADDDQYPSPDLLREVLIGAGFEADNFSEMVDMAAVGITAPWWRNTKVEEWRLFAVNRA
jgi:hypothetical protein